MKVPFSYLDRQFADVDDYLKDVRAHVQTGDFTLGKPLRDFEESFAKKARMPHAPAAGGAETLAPIEACPAGANEASIGGRQSGREEYRHEFGRKAK